MRVAPERGAPSRKRRPSPSSGTATRTPARPRRPQSVDQHRAKFAAQRPNKKRHPCNGATPTRVLRRQASPGRMLRASAAPAKGRRAVERGRAARREARVPAGQFKNAAPSGARSAGQSASSKNPAHSQRAARAALAPAIATGRPRRRRRLGEANPRRRVGDIERGAGLPAGVNLNIFQLFSATGH